MPVAVYERALASPKKEPTSRFYRPELDALRFFAFGCVLIRHGAPIPVLGGKLIQEIGSFGLSLFFFLSAFLITELLVREREKTGTVHLKAFYIRRILRIWPLYFLAVFLAVLIGRLWPDAFWISRLRLISMVFFFMNWVPQAMYGPFTPLWSISVEEQFYAIWPAVAKGGTTALKVGPGVLVFGSLIMLSVGAPRHYAHLWQNTIVEFLFFGAGAFTALAVRRKAWKVNPGWRVLWIATGIALWAAAQIVGNVASDAVVPSAPLACLSYLLAAAGCLAMLLAVLDVKPRAVPGALIYLGKISYGLYVFHKMFLMILGHWTRELSQGWTFFVVNGGALLLSIGLASISYRFMERPINCIKERFAFVPSRPA